MPSTLVVVFLVCVAVQITASPFREDPESLRRALDGLSRKQRSLDLQQSRYYKPQSFKYDDDLVDEDQDEDLRFISLDNGRLEPIDSDFHRSNYDQLEKTLVNYVKVPSPQRDITSFRERLNDHKHELFNNVNRQVDDDELAKIFLDALRSPEDENSPVSADNLQSLYRKYRLSVPNHGWDEPWPEKHRFYPVDDIDEAYERLGGKFGDSEDIGQYNTLRNGGKSRYLISRDYRTLTKRFPLVKRSTMTKSTSPKTPNTDPKVAQDLKDLFGTSPDDTTGKSNSTQHTHSYSDSPKSTPPSTTDTSTLEETEVPRKTTSQPNSGHSIQLRKKSIDWSSYFGIDRRRKKTEFLAKPGTQEQDDEWLLQRYYNTMADNLRGSASVMDKSSEKRDKLEQMDERLKSVKDLMVRDAAKYSENQDPEDPQKVKDVVMARLAAAYSLEKMRRALSEFRNSISAERAWSRDGNSSLKDAAEKKNSVKHDVTVENQRCPELEAIERSCKSARGLFSACVKQQVCKICNDDKECEHEFAEEASRICNDLESPELVDCVQTALLLSEMHLPPGIHRMRTCYEALVGTSCLRRHSQRDHHRDFYASRHRNDLGDGNTDSSVGRWL